MSSDENFSGRSSGTYNPDKRSRFSTPLPGANLGKLQPQATDLEEAVLGALMLEKDALSSVIDVLKPEVFYRDSHQKIFTAIKTLFEKTSPVDILTVTAQLRQQGDLEMIGGAYYITELTNRVASAANIEFHARIIIQKFLQRELIRISTEV
ncbi:MAG: replicative DNA helicase, partial [Sphingobacteriaceae bacterium]